MQRKFSLAYLTIPGVEAMDQIRIAADAGYDYVSLRTIPMGQPGEPQLRLEEDPPMLERIREAMNEYGVKLLDIELVRIREDLPEDHRAAFEAGASLGATNVLSSVWTDNFDFAAERYAKICEQAAEFGLDVNLEFPIVSRITTFAQAVEMQRRVNMPNLKIFVDTLYAHIDGVTEEDIKSIPPENYGIIHLCDCPHKEKFLDTLHIVREAREYCGEGEINLPMLLKALPAHPCSIELPNLVNIHKYGGYGHAKRCLQKAKELFAAYDL
ncbi:MAG: sugar phosphate isomerase/epimerase [Oscillospiraceae bacterium]|nr:sugar phosphate isomerase/epimerase [Oscillospiraceae bacterium]MBQ9938437.1 sugar phosphate isomerase/epimerase [Oscillospiraceae bacterium]